MFPCVLSLSPSHNILFSTLLFLPYLVSPSLPLSFPCASHSLISWSPPSTPYVPLFLSFHSSLILYPFFSFTKSFFLSFFFPPPVSLSHTTHPAEDNLCVPPPTVKSLTLVFFFFLMLLWDNILLRYCKNATLSCHHVFIIIDIEFQNVTPKNRVY